MATEVYINMGPNPYKGWIVFVYQKILPLSSSTTRFLKKNLLDHLLHILE
jgi:hypothetical protein